MPESEFDFLSVVESADIDVREYRFPDSSCYLLLKPLSTVQLQNIYRQCNTPGSKGREKFNEAKARELIYQRVIKGWRGMTPEFLKQLGLRLEIPVGNSPLDPKLEIKFAGENGNAGKSILAAIEIGKKSRKFNRFIYDICVNEEEMEEQQAELEEEKKT